MYLLDMSTNVERREREKIRKAKSGDNIKGSDG